MISNERRWPSQRQPQRPPQPYYNYNNYNYNPQHGDQPPMRPSVPEDTLASKEVQIERKHFRVMLKENARGRFVRIAEDTGGRINSIIIPAEGLVAFQKLLQEMVEASEQATPPPPPSPT
jgi:hypothetical protein